MSKTVFVGSSDLPERRSEFARELARLPERVRRLLGIAECHIAIVELAVTTAAVFTDDSDSRPPTKRFDQGFFDSFVNGVDFSPVEGQLRALSEGDVEATSAKIVRRLSSPGFRQFLQRLLGAATYDRFRTALERDLAVVLLAIRQGIRHSLPFALAFDKCLQIMSPQQLARLPNVPENISGTSVLELIAQLDGGIQRFVTLPPTSEGASCAPDALPAMAELGTNLLAQVSDQSRGEVAALNERLAAKLTGARDALTHSSDPVSQAANSLVELLDRLLRAGFDDTEILSWIDTYCSSRSAELTYTKDDIRRPTKHGQALCLVYAGSAVDEPLLFHELAAVTIVEARRQLQGLKHADLGTEQERFLIEELFACVEGLFLIICRLSWLTADKATLNRIRCRLADPVAA